jgi:hypothetical protein
MPVMILKFILSSPAFELSPRLAVLARLDRTEEQLRILRSVSIDLVPLNVALLGD